jgi:hypothetical protein
MAASAPYAPWNGTKPFACKVQDVGAGTDFPDPEADPFCVKFDKTHQNITEGGLVDFLLEEPARVAAASPKCQYFQKDHWTGRIVQDDARTELYNFKGRYYFDKSSGAGGVYVRQFRILGRPADPASLPGMPEEFQQYFSNGGGGAKLDFGMPSSPLCTAATANARTVARTAAADDYYTTTTPDDYYTTPKPGGGKKKNKCIRVKGKVTKKGLGKARLGDSAGKLKKAIGKPAKLGSDYYRYCTKKPERKRLLVGFKGNKVAYVGTNVEKVKLQGVGTDDKVSKAKKKLKHEKKQGKLLVVDSGKADFVLATKGDFVESVGVADPKLSGKLLKKFANFAG